MPRGLLKLSASHDAEWPAALREIRAHEIEVLVGTGNPLLHDRREGLGTAQHAVEFLRCVAAHSLDAKTFDEQRRVG